MTPEQIQELKNLIDTLQSQGLSREEIEIQLDNKRREFRALNKSNAEKRVDEELGEEIVGKPDTVVDETVDATVETEDTDLQSEDSSSESIYEQNIPEKIKIKGQEYPIEYIETLLGQPVENGFFNGKNVYPNTIKEFIDAYGDDAEIIYKDQDVKQIIEDKKREVVVTADYKPTSDFIKRREELIKNQQNEIFVTDEEWAENNQVTLFGKIPGTNASGSYRTTAERPEEYIKYINEAKKQLSNELGPENLLAPSEEQVLTRAGELWAQNEKNSIIDEVIEEELNKNITLLNLKEDKKIKESSRNLAKTEQKFIDEDLKIADYKARSIKSVYDNKIKQITDLQSKTYNNQEELNEAIEIKKFLVDEANVLGEKNNSLLKEFESLNLKYKDNNEILDVVSRYYDTPDIFLSSLVASTIDIASGLYAVPRWLKETTETILGVSDENKTANDWVLAMASPAANAFFGKGSEKINGFLSNVSENLRGAIAKPKEIEEIDGLGGFGAWTANMVGSQVPIMATLLAAPNASLAMLGSSAAGGKFLEMEEAIDAGEKISGWQLLAAPAMVGLGEYVTEKVSLGQLSRVARTFKNNKTVIDSAKDYLIKDWKKWVRDANLEGGAEVLATLSENFADKVILGKEDVSWTRGLTNAYASGAFMSGVIYKSPYLATRIANPFIGTDTREKILEGSRLIKDLEAELESDNLTDFEKENITKTIYDITKKQNQYLSNAITNIDKLNEGQKTRLIEIENELYDTAGKYDKNKNSNLSDKAKETEGNILKAKYDNLIKEKNSIIGQADESNFDARSFALKEFEDKVSTKKMTLNEYTSEKANFLGDQLKSLYALRKKEKDSDTIKYLDLKIKNTEEQLTYIIPKGMGFVGNNTTTISKSNNITQLAKAFVAKSQELLSLRNKNEITQSQYESQYKRAKNAYDKKRQSLLDVEQKTKADKYTQLQDFYDNNLDETGKLKSDTKTVNDFKQRVGAIVEAATKRLFDGIDPNLRLTNREDFKEVLSNNAWLLARDEFDPSIQSLDRFISNRLNLRANRTAKKSADQGGFTESISENPNLGSSILEEVQEQEEARQAIKTAKAMQIPDSIIEKARKAAISALSTISNKVDATKFKSEIAQAFKDALYADLKRLFGKDTKTNKAFTQSLINNIRPFYDVLTVESMRKARNNKTGINPFVELGLLDADGNKVAFEDIDQEAFVNFYTGKDKAKGTMSDRRMNLIEAVASSLGAAQAIDLLNNDASVREKFLSRQAQETEISNKGLDLLVPKAFRGFINILKDLAQATSINSVAKILGLKDITVNDTNRFEKQQAVLNSIEKYSLTINAFEAAMPASSGAVRSRDSKGDVYYKLSNGKKIIGSRPAANLRQVDKNNKKIFNLPTLESIENEFGKGVTLVASRGRLYYGKTDPAYIDDLA